MRSRLGAKRFCTLPAVVHLAVTAFTHRGFPTDQPLQGHSAETGKRYRPNLRIGGPVVPAITHGTEIPS